MDDRAQGPTGQDTYDKRLASEINTYFKVDICTQYDTRYPFKDSYDFTEVFEQCDIIFVWLW